MHGLMRKRGIALAVVSSLGMGSAAMAAPSVTFFTFSADPNITANYAEYTYSPSSGLAVGPGAIGDGTIGSPGLLGTITGGLAGIPDSPPGLGSGPLYNQLLDLTLDLTGFAADGSATVATDNIAQGLTGGTFTVRYHPASGPDLVLLTGTTDSAVLTERDTGLNASALSGTVTYTGGVLLGELGAAGLSNTGSFAFEMSALTGTYGTTTVGTDSRLIGFSADGTGTFDAIALPDPSGGLIGLGAIGLLGVMRRSRRTA